MRKIFSLLFLFILSLSIFGCDKEKTPEEQAHVHTYSTSYSYNADSHWYDCSCGEKKGANPHTWDSGTIIKEPTEIVPGEKKYTCTECGKTKSEEIAKIVHEHQFENWVPEVAATCDSEGSKGYRHCASCDKYYDANGNEIKASDLIIPTLGHSFVKVEAKEPTCTEDGNIAHVCCENCGTKTVFSNEEITLKAHSEWEAAYPWGNFTDGTAKIIVDDFNTCLKLQVSEWYPKQTGFSKDTGSRLTQAGTYVVSLDVKGSESVINSIRKAKLDIIYCFDGGTVKVSDGINNLGSVSSEWITLEFEFVVPSGISNKYSNFMFFYWAEDTLDNNYLLIDNFKVYAKGDATKTNLDEYGRGDFEGYIPTEEIDNVTIPKTHQFGELVELVPATCKDKGMKAHYQCLLCNKYFNESKEEVIKASLEVESLGGEHTYDELVDEVDATCESSGMKAHYKCNNCETYFDAEEQEIAYKDLIIEVTGHKLTYYATNNKACNEGGYIGHQKCDYCGIAYGFTENKIALQAHGQWTNYPYGNWTDQEIEIINDNGNTCMRMEPISWYPDKIGFKKDISTTILQSGSYRLLIDVKAGTNEHSNKGKLDLLMIYNGGKVAISDGIFNLGTVKQDSWTTLEFEFTMPSGIRSDYLNLDGYFWPEVSLGGNYILIDNIRIVKSDDETNTNLDVLGFGDFEGMLARKEMEDVANHSWGEGVVTKEATETEKGIKTYTCVNCSATKTKEYVYGLSSSIKILGIGNSYTDDSFTRLYDVLSSLGYENVTVGLMIIGGTGLDDHWKNFSADAAKYEYRLNVNGIQTTKLETKASTVLAEEWDYILFNQKSAYTGSGNFTNIDEYIDYVSSFQDEDTEIIFNMTWSNVTNAAYGTDHYRYYEDIVSNTQELIVPRTDIDGICPCGTAIQNVRKATNEELLRDGLHLDLYYGRFIASLMIAKYVSGSDISVVDYPASITLEQFEIAVKAVNAAYENNYQITELN